MDNKNIVLISLSREELRSLISDAIKDSEKMKQEKEILSFKEVCNWLKISASCLYNWKRENKIPYKRQGRRIFFLRSDVLAALKDSNYSRMKELNN